MSFATGLVLTVRTASASKLSPPNYPIIRSLLEHRPELVIGADGTRCYTYRMTEAEIRSALDTLQVGDARPTPEGIASCLAALAQEAREIGLEQASWAIDLAAQLIALG